MDLESKVWSLLVFKNDCLMKQFSFKVFVFSTALLFAFGVFAFASAQNRNVRDTQAKVVAAFNSQCATNNFPKKQLRGEIKRAMQELKDQFSRPETDGKYAVAYDLNGDGQKEYFVWLKDTGIGDNVFWGVFALKPTRFLGVIFAEHIFLRCRVNGWAALTAASHLSSSDSFVTTYAFRNGKYVKAAGGYEVSANRNDEPSFFSKTPYLLLCVP
ncbi:MAG: hypothetical protein M3033_09670 [Acidobacteriota bacterium]|nr:hypothetical protein [Acidobacteriota bacterium]